LKVSGQGSHRLLVEKQVPVYRVTDVSGKSPSIYVLIHKRDFELEAEPRWTFKPIRATSKR